MRQAGGMPGSRVVWAKAGVTVAAPSHEPARMTMRLLPYGDTAILVELADAAERRAFDLALRRLG